ncbi:protein phosphatase 1 regulatory subunit 36 isoform X1 [Cygnus olor]|uniref:protein phosphatase 1 regulatory subunit 36 isoform X1 n=1 Tax=Cygnus olor TaxID=8869 RepID=UPI001ADEAA08|nr:protein phosphatase 1 regulatory subunit 36 isoform X1 [Cygnus olor]
MLGEKELSMWTLSPRARSRPEGTLCAGICSSQGTAGCYRDAAVNRASLSAPATSQASAMISTIKLTSGVWYWKDDTNTLEFASSSPTSQENLKEGKNTCFREICVKTLKSIFQHECSATLPEKRLADKEEKIHKLSKWVQHEYVTLDDVKYVALLLKEEEKKSERMLPFAAVMGNKKLDEFLMALLFYLSFYLEKIALEKETTSLISTMIFLENKEMDDVLAKLAVARIHLAKVYSNFILGRGMAQQSHSPSGKRTILQKDRDFFEGFYKFCSYVAWLVFRQKHFQVIREEIGRLLCSDMFNPTLRDRSNVFLQEAGKRTADADAVRLPCQRQAHAKHPPINSMVHQRSPMLSTLLPLPKESAHYLSQNHYCRGRDPRPCSCDNLPDFSELFATKVGIIGAHCSELNSCMLKSDGAMEEDEQEQEQEHGRQRSCSSVLTNGLNLPPL